MNIFVIGANGRQGKLLVKEAINQGYQVTAVTKSELIEKHQEKVNVLKKDLFDLTTEDLKLADVVIDAFGIFDPEKLDQHQTSLSHLTDILSKTNKRLMIVGGAGSLFVNPEKTIRLLDTPEFPKDYQPLAQSMAIAFENLQKVNDVKWTYLSPAAIFDPETQATGQYQIGEDNVILNQKGQSYVTYGDYAKAMIDEIKNQKFINQRFTVIGE
ncbi:putative NADH-flavin reductase [Spiroplasma sabaudiense Ar-1343]|uniref:Putative NADH-flavin reductase n=1 Tax=Spiroplasma sabaudiense Ar-1343 TaxID=1276257 RepID=W6AAI3_9MOLU|nr:NAD(P)H-binding protein [Spiroplasma sabaudiense]AHI53855.1 putative NADH-flavin reductase [Spiroplasma sabaudiense Ar-1343]